MVSIIRGRVLTPTGQALGKVRVQVKTDGYWTLTRPDGYFDLLVTGGKVVKLLFGKFPLKFKHLSLFVPKNQVIKYTTITIVDYFQYAIFQISVIEDVYLQHVKERNGRSISSEPFCSEHSSMVTRAKINVIDSISGSRKLFVSEKVNLEDSEVGLVYNSEKQDSYLAIMKIKLLERMPVSLIQVVTKIIVEGNVYTEVHEAQHNLSMTFKWNGYNVYGQKHYGLTYATVKIGYKYKMCHEVMWEVLKVKIHGHTPLSTDIGGWNLNIHHLFNSRDGIVYKGDGDILSMEKKEKIVQVVNENFSKTIMSPIVILKDNDDMYIGDSKFIRKVDAVGKVTNLLKLNESMTAHKYYMTMTVGRTKSLIVSDPVGKRILKIPTMVPSVRTVLNNFEIILESKCNVYDKDCNEKDNLVYPKGIVVTPQEEIIFIDGSTLKIINIDKKVYTIAGFNKAATDWRPSKCGDDVAASEASFKWPTEVSINPVTSDITFLDQGSILSLTKDGRVMELYSINCPGKYKSLETLPKSLTYSQNGELYIADENNIIMKLNHDGKIQEIAGSMIFCKRSTYGCLQSDFDEIVTLGSKARFLSISSIFMSTDDVMYVTDTDKHHIRSISTKAVSLNEVTEKFEIISPETEEIFIFDKHGRHDATKGLYLSQSIGIDFFYSEIEQKLIEVADRYMNKIKLKNNNGLINQMSLSNGQNLNFQYNKHNHLKLLYFPGGMVNKYKYNSKGLIVRKLVDNKLQFSFDYGSDSNHLKKVNGLAMPTDAIKKNKYNYIIEEDKLLNELYGFESKFHPMITGLSEEHNNVTIHEIKWDYFIHSARTRSSFAQDVDGIGKRMLINNEIALTSELHPRSMIRSLYDQNGIQLLRVEEYGVPKRTILFPRSPYQPVDQTYDEVGRPTKWSRGNMFVLITHDKTGRLTAIEDCEVKETYLYNYDDSYYPNKRNNYMVELDNTGGLERIITPSGKRHQFELVPQFGVMKFIFRPSWGQKDVIFIINERGQVTRIEQENVSAILFDITEDNTYIQCEDTSVQESLDDGAVLRTLKQGVFTVQDKQHATADGFFVSKKIKKESKDLLSFDQFCAFEKRTHELICESFIKEINSNLTSYTKLDEIKGKKTNIDAFELIESLQSYAWVDRLNDIIVKHEVDGFGRVSRKDIKIKSKSVYSLVLEFNCRGKLITQTEIFNNRNPLKRKYEYNKMGMIQSVDGNTYWKYNYDDDGNFIEVVNSLGKISFEIEAGERISGVKGRDLKVTYGLSGEVKHRDGHSYLYNCRKQLIKVFHGDNVWKEVVYDALGRPILIMDHLQNNNLTLLYNNMDKEKIWDVSHWIENNSNLMSPTYDNDGHILSIQTKTQSFIVVNDVFGTPYIFFNQEGEILKEVSYSPFGMILQDSEVNFLVPVGFHGGISIEGTNIVLIEGRPYDSLLGQWMVPDMTQILSLPRSSDVTDIHLYRFNKNDPVNKQTKFSPMTTLNSWLNFFGYNLQSMKTSVLKRMIFKGIDIPNLIVDDIDNGDKDRVSDPNVQKLLMINKEKRNINLARSFHIASPLLPHVILTRKQQMIQAIVVEGVSPLESMVAGIINNTVILENYGDTHKCVYLIKTKGLEEETVSNLKKSLEVEERSIPPHGKEICFDTSQNKLCILSGIESIEGHNLRDSLISSNMMSDNHDILTK